MIWTVNEFCEGAYKLLFRLYSSGFINHGAGFDIETTQCVVDGKHIAFMYIWQFAIGDDVILGRTWTELRTLLKYIQSCLGLGTEKRLLCFVHNFPFEFSFIKFEIPWEINPKTGAKDIFFLAPKKPIKALSCYGIEFRDSLVLSGCSLKETAKHYTKTQKMVGDLDYSKYRNSYTVLDDKEIQYCINDAIICKEYADYILEEYWDKVPMTKTGIVRQIGKNAHKQMDFRKEYDKDIFKAFPFDEETYTEMMRWLYCGGWVHANYLRTGELIEGPDIDMRGFDFKSSYPFQMIHALPGRFKTITPKREYLDKWIQKTPDVVGWTEDSWSMIIDITVTDMSIKSCHSVFSSSKIRERKGKLYLDNGRIRYCDECRIMLTDMDYHNLVDFYDFKIKKVNKLRIAKNELLPDFYLECIHRFFQIKNTAPKDSLDYKLAKENFNSLYGMMVTGLIKDNLIFNECSGDGEPGGQEKSYHRVKAAQWLLPQWGIWVSAGARRRLLRIVHQISELGGAEHVCYGDTDSAKILYASRYKSVIDAYNEECLKYNKWLADLTGYDFGKLGIFENEGQIKRFKTLGCKRYIWQDRLYNTHITIAGLPKDKLMAYAIQQGKDIFEVFDNELYLSPLATDKLVSAYSKAPYEAVIIDEQGHQEHMKSKSGVCLYNVPFNMHLAVDYITYLRTCTDNRKFKFGIRGV